MTNETDILIIGAGPTGLMLASQLVRFGVPFRIIDKQADRNQESRAFGIQAKTMEIFQNLGIEGEFLKRAEIAKKINFYVNGKLKFVLNFENIKIEDTPFPHLYLLPQSETEQILLDHLQKKDISIERQKQLVSFTQTQDAIVAEIKNDSTQAAEQIRCRYIIGCDGARSIVRRILEIPFEGATYKQEFVLADVSIQAPFDKESFSFFMSKEGFLGFIPLQQDFSRLMLASMGKQLQPSDQPPSLNEIQAFTKSVTQIDAKLSNPIWISRFSLHHRAVQYYQKDSAFLAGDAAHIHSPVGGQGMNTGLQDATNLAWKLALTLKYQLSPKLLETYNTERHRIGQILVNSTDKMFGLITSRNFIITLLRLYLVPIVMRFLSKSEKFLRRIFCFSSELGIHYHENTFVTQKTQGADKAFLSGPQAGWRAPDAPILHSTLFELFKEKPCHILIFQTTPNTDRIKELEKIHPEIIAIHQFSKSAHTQILFDRYGVTQSAIYFIRPDGYIGFRSYGDDFDALLQYLQRW